MFIPSERSERLAERLRSTMSRHVYPSERRYYLGAGRLGPQLMYLVVQELMRLARVLRLVDGSDEVHSSQIAKQAICGHRSSDPAQTGDWAEALSVPEAEWLEAEGLWPKPMEFPA